MNRILTGKDTASSPRYIALGDAVVDRFARSVHLDGKAQQLEPRVAGVLDCLVAEAGIPVTRAALLDRVWGADGSDEALTQTVSRLRRMLGESVEIRTQPRVGYVLATKPRPSPGPETAAVTGGSAASVVEPQRSLPLWAGITIGALGMALAAAIIFFGFFRIEREVEFITVDHPLAEEAAALDRE